MIFLYIRMYILFVYIKIQTICTVHTLTDAKFYIVEHLLLVYTYQKMTIYKIRNKETTQSISKLIFLKLLDDFYHWVQEAIDFRSKIPRERKK